MNPAPPFVPTHLLDTPLMESLQKIDLHGDEWDAIRRCAPGMVGQLSDVLLSARNTIEVRLRSAGASIQCANGSYGICV